jgi:plasmid maintenance system antidote protein VapI
MTRVPPPMVTDRSLDTRHVTGYMSKAFGASTASWMNQQAQYDRLLAERSAGKMKVKRLADS